MSNIKLKKNVLLTGAAGGVGSEVLKQLIAKKDQYSITVFELPTPNNQAFLEKYKGEITLVYGDITRKEDLLACCSQQDAVIHLAAMIPPAADDLPDKAFAVNAKGTENLVEALAEKSPRAFLLFSSSVAIYGDRLSQPWIKVGDALVPSEGDEYGKTKIYAEKVIQASPLKWTIFRLSAIMGKHTINKLMFHMPLDTPMEIATLADAARAFVHGLEKQSELEGRIFNLGGGEKNRILYRDFLNRSFELFGLGKADFPPLAFATHNFHCGYFSDGDELEKIVHFRQDDLDSYFLKVKQSVSWIKKLFATLFRPLIKWFLFRSSEPYHAFNRKDPALMKRFFGTSPTL